MAFTGRLGTMGSLTYNNQKVFLKPISVKILKNKFGYPTGKRILEFHREVFNKKKHNKVTWWNPHMHMWGWCYYRCATEIATHVKQGYNKSIYTNKNNYLKKKITFFHAKWQLICLLYSDVTVCIAVQFHCLCCFSVDGKYTAQLHDWDMMWLRL